MGEGMICSRLYFDGIAQVDQFDSAEGTMLIQIDHNVVGLDICCPISEMMRETESS